mgnify:CR=1 FL=1
MLKDLLSFSPVTYVKPKSPLHGKEPIIAVGEQPGKTEVNRGEPFVGPAGKVLNECVNEAGLVRQNFYLTNVIKDLDASIDHYIQFKRNGPSITAKGREYIELLKSELVNHPAEIIIAVGGVSLYALTNRTGITKWRGSVLNCELVPGKLVIPIIHPATVIPPKFQYLNRHLIKFDLVRARRIIENGYHPTPRNIIIGPSYDKVMEFLYHCITEGTNGKTIYYDLEVYNEEVSCISFSVDKHEAISIPFISPHGPYFPINQEAEIWKLIATILENPTLRKGGQNIGFDAHFLLRKYGIKAKNLDDTMVAEQIILPDYPKGLDFITSIWTDHPYYKDEGKRWFKVGGTWEQLWHYNGTDSIICTEAFPNQWKSIVSQGNSRTYERQRLLIEPLVFMQEHGIRVDVEGMRTLRDEYLERIDNLQEQLNELAGKPLNPNSPDQLKKYFYIEKGYDPYKFKGSITTNDLAMKRLSRKGCKEADIVRNIRSLRKLVGNYLNLDKIDSDNRIRCSYNPVGTRYSRISSSESIFGTGMNMQNWPHDMLKYLLPDEGYVFYSFDLSQAENRIVAYVGRIRQMIDAFESGKDVHSLTGALISGKDPEEVKLEDKQDIKCSLGDGSKTWRFWGKKANHGLNYDLGFKTFALYYEIPERDAKFIVDRYHQVYPGVRQGFHSFVKQQLSKNRTLENLMGRRTIFLDQWGDNLLKEAYSCIPQGTTGDVINERGIIYTYYNQNQFRPLSLLNQVHDSTGFQLPLSLPWIEHARMLMDVKKELETPLTTHYGDTFVVPADLTVGCSLWKEGHGEELKSTQIPDDLESFAHLLEQTYNACHAKKYGAQECLGA